MLFGFCLQGQCENWNDSSQRELLQNSYSIYRNLLKQEKYAAAYPHWMAVYDVAPMADGGRSCLFSDGRKLLLDRIQTANLSESDRKLVSRFLVQLVADHRFCFPDHEIEPLPDFIIEY